MDKLLSKALAMEQSGRWEESAEIYEKLLIEHPQNSLIELNYAACLFKMQIYDRALDLFVRGYNHSLHPAEKQQILTHVINAYYTPNIDTFRQTYRQNVEGMLAYEYNYISAFPAYDDLPFVCIPRSAGSYYIFVKPTSQILENPFDLSVGDACAAAADVTVLAVNIYNAETITAILEQTADPSWQNSRKRPLYLLWTQAHYLLYLQLQDFRPILAAQRVVFFSDCGMHFTNYFKDYQSYLPEKIIGAAEAIPSINESLQVVLQEREEDYTRKLTAVRQMAERYDRSFYNGLFYGDLRNIRVLCINSRFSRVIQYATRDFMLACEERGLTCDTVIEKSDIHVVTPHALLDKIIEFRPNVIFRINFFRDDFPGLPENILFLTWMQDPGRQIYSPQCAAKFSWPDFALAMPQWLKLMAAHGFEPVRMSPQLLPFNDRLFYERSLTEEEREFYGAAIALPGNYDSPENALADLINALCDQMPVSNGDKGHKEKLATQMLIQAYEVFRTQIAAGTLIATNEQCARVIKEQADIVGFSSVEHLLCGLAEAFLLRICYNLHRQTTLNWVVEGGFPLKIWGRDWDKADELRRFSCGVLQHGEDLAKMYSATRIILATFSSYTGHFRVFEALACGALPFIRYVPEEHDQGSIRDNFREGEDFVFYYNKADLLNKLDYYLKHEDERLKIVANGRKRALEYATYRNVVDNFLGLVRRNLG